MVCQDQIQQIIMLTNLSEKGEVLYLEMKKISKNLNRSNLTI